MSTIYYREANKPRSQQLRRDMTPQERHLWYDFLRGLPIQVRRQKAFGNYIADFYCAERNLVIELDGSQHHKEEAEEYDRRRDDYLERLGLTVVRLENADIDRRFGDICRLLWHMMGLDERE